MHYRTRIVVIAMLLAVACGRGKPPINKADAVRRGDEAFAKNDFPVARAAYSSASQADPQDADVIFKLARTLNELKQWPEATRQALRAADLKPDDQNIQILATTLLLRQKRFEDARDRASTRLQVLPNDPRMLILLGSAKALLTSPDRGVTEFDEAWRNNRSIEGARINMRTRPMHEDDRQAEDLFRRAFGLDSGSREMRLALTSFLWVTERMEEGAEILKVAAAESPNDPLTNRVLGLYYESKGNRADAEKLLKLAAAHDDRDSNLALAEFYLRGNRRDEAVTLLEAIAAKNDPDNAATLRAADVELSVGKPAPALERANRILGKDKNQAVALRVKAQALLALGDKTQALTIARNAVGVAPTSRDARIALAAALVANGDLKRAFDEYSEAWRSDMRDPAVAKTLASLAYTLGQYGVAEDLANQSMRLMPGDPEAAVIYVRAQVRLGDYSAAERVLTPLLGKGNPSPDILALQGAIQAGRGNNDAARSIFLKALQVDRDSLEALTGLVNVETKSHRASQAHAHLDPAVARHPSDVAYLILAARIAAAENDNARAEKSLRSILAIDPAREDALVLLATVVGRQGRLQEAQSVIEKGLERVSTSSTLRLSLADLFEQQGRTDDARTQYEKIISENQVPGATNDMLLMLHTASSRQAAMYANQGVNLDVALRLASAAKRFFPTDASFSDTLGWVHIRNDRAKVGIPYVQAALQAEPDNALFHYHLGAAYEEMADFEKARAELNKALQLNPSFRGADQARAILKTLPK